MGVKQKNAKIAIEFAFIMYEYTSSITTMPRVDIRRSHGLSSAQAHAVIDRIAARMREKFQVKTQWQCKDTLSFQRLGIDGKIVIEANEIHVSARLGMLLSPLKTMIEQEIRRHLDEHFT